MEINSMTFNLIIHIQSSTTLQIMQNLDFSYQSLDINDFKPYNPINQISAEKQIS